MLDRRRRRQEAANGQGAFQFFGGPFQYIPTIQERKDARQRVKTSKNFKRLPEERQKKPGEESEPECMSVQNLKTKMQYLNFKII